MAAIGPADTSVHAPDILDTGFFEIPHRACLKLLETLREGFQPRCHDLVDIFPDRAHDDAAVCCHTAASGKRRASSRGVQSSSSTKASLTSITLRPR